MNLSLKSEITGETCFCYNCGSYSHTGEFEEGSVIVNDIDLDDKLKYICPNCGSDSTEFSVNIKISCDNK
jgi:RNA polymerase subunit RPABC4/transcription elongation factor Spt4